MNGHTANRTTLYAATLAALVLACVYLVSLPSKNNSSTLNGCVGAGCGGGSTKRSPSSGGSGEVYSPKTALKGLSAMSSSGGGGGVGGGGGGDGTKNKEELDEEDIDPLKVTEGSVTYGDDEQKLPFYHCGPFPSDENPDLTEVILLHGAAFTKEDWKTSGILDLLCEINNEEDEGNLSITALDLPVSADGARLASAFESLAMSNVIMGKPATFVTPSASGKAIVSLAAMASVGGDDSETSLSRMVKAWIPVACGAVLGASDEVLSQFASERREIPVLAIHGDQDETGRKSTERLREAISGAGGVELEGRHPVYLDSPEEFVQEVMQFLDEMGL